MENIEKKKSLGLDIVAIEFKLFVALQSHVKQKPFQIDNAINEIL